LVIRSYCVYFNQNANAGLRDVKYGEIYFLQRKLKSLGTVGYDIIGDLDPHFNVLKLGLIRTSSFHIAFMFNEQQ